jgi:hypothetical protein
MKPCTVYRPVVEDLNITLMSSRIRIPIRNKVKSWIRIRIEVKSWIRIRVHRKAMRTPSLGYGDFNN